MSSILDVEQSLMLSRWVMPGVDINTIEKVMRRHDLPEVIARLLIGRGVPEEEIENFLNPTLKNDFPDPFSMVGMEDMASYMAQAITDKRSIAVFGDFDVDGATSSALLHRFFKHFGLDVPFYIPDRLSEGYGPNLEALKKLKSDGAEIVIMVDCGTTAFETVQQGRDLGLEIIILDHHEAEEKLPNANHVINPKRKDDNSGLDMLAAVGVGFMTCVGINNKLREQGYYKDAAEPPLKDWLDIVALGTVCDMVPLTDVNRLLVRSGLTDVQNTGIKALMDVAGIEPPMNTYACGFVLGPRINAGSRVHQADLGSRLLSTNDAEEAKNIAWTLNDCNDKRKAIQETMEREAIEQVEAQGLDQSAVIIVGDESWHAGLSGLVAGRLKEKYNKPAIVVTYAANMDGVVEGRGSGRSVPGIHIAQAFIDARNEGLIEKGGGHAMAGGFTVAPDKLSAFQEFLQTHIAKQAEDVSGNVETTIDAMMMVQGVQIDYIRLIQDHVGPFGQEHPEPLVALGNVRIQSADVVGSAHIRVMVSDWEGGGRLKAMAFRAVGTPLGDALLKQGRQPFHLLGHLKINSWQGRETPEMHIKDAAFAVAGEEVQKQTA
ncbi:MAG: single-stranded-DNA-specific exonuclease RecJ [Micavibrio sp.]|nr:MAG: single-stranded-DNA-specific exonuclease RecJ [Micavibrio sp.]